MASLLSKWKEIRHAWNAFKNWEENVYERTHSPGIGSGASTRPDRTRLRTSNERSIIASIYTRLGIDAASVDIRHVRHDENGRYLEDMKSGLNECLTVDPNRDQVPRHFRQDIYMTLFDRSSIAIVPIDVDVNPAESASFDIKTMRVGYIVDWFPEKVMVDLYDQRDGLRKRILVDKKYAAIVENPFSMVMNEPNSTLQRIIRKLNLLDVVDEQSSSGKLDLIIQLPYVIKSEAKRQQAQQRREEIETQLTGSKYGIAYTDGTEKVVQLNRPAENNLLKQIEYLMELLYSQLGITQEVMNGTADEKTMLNYINRTIEPLVTAVVEAMRRSFLTKTARSQGQSIDFFRDPFKLVPLADLAEIADKFTRSEVASSNDLRQIVGWKPSTDPKADELRNTNMPPPKQQDPQMLDPTAVDETISQSQIRAHSGTRPLFRGSTKGNRSRN